MDCSGVRIVSKSLSLTLTTAVVCLAACGNAWCDDAAAEPERRLETSLPVSGYPERWCIRTYVSEVRSQASVPIARTATSQSLNYRYIPMQLKDEIPEEFDDRSSLLERLKALKNVRLATLWQGRNRSLVVGVQDGGYLGVSLDNPDNDESP